MAASDAGDGNENDFAVWENPRLVASGRPDLALRDVRAAVAALRVLLPLALTVGCGLGVAFAVLAGVCHNPV